MSPLIEKKQEILSEENLNYLAIQSGFKKRESKISPKMFFDNLIYNASSAVNRSLNSLSINLQQDYNVSVSKQGIDERYTEKATLYLKSILEQFCFVCHSPIDEGWLGNFNNVRIKDSTRFVLPERYAEMMPGFGGVSSKAGACIQYEYDLKTGSILDINITPANRPDSKDARNTQDKIEVNDLVIRDLGYYSIDVIGNFIEKRAYLISKLNAKALAYEIKVTKYEPLDFKKIYSWMKKRNLRQIEKQVYIGPHVKLPVRLIIEIVPDEVFSQRMQKVNKYNKRKGYTTSDDYADRARFNLIITNIAVETMPIQAIVALYHIRWQVELVFKIWKSTFGVHKIGKMKYYRWLSILYAKLILIIIYWQTIMPTRSWLYKEKGRLLSIDKCFKTLKGETDSLRDAIRKGGQELGQIIQRLIELISEKHWLEKKKNKLNFEQILYLNYCKSNIYVYI